MFVSLTEHKRVSMINTYLFVCLWLGHQLWDELETDVHGGDVGYHHRQQSLRVALEVDQLHHLWLCYEHLHRGGEPELLTRTILPSLLLQYTQARKTFESVST